MSVWLLPYEYKLWMNITVLKYLSVNNFTREEVEEFMNESLINSQTN